MAMLLGTLLAFGRLSGDSEHIAFFAGGISFFRAIVPVAVMGVLVTVATFAWNELIVPPAQSEFLRLKATVVQDATTSGKPFFYPVKDRNSDRIDEFVNIAGGFDRVTGWFKGITILKMSEDPERMGQAEFYVYADRARPADGNELGLNWLFEDIKLAYLKDVKGVPEFVSTMESATTEVISRQLGSEIGMRRTFRELIETQKKDNRTMTFSALRDKIRKERESGNLNTAGDEVDLWEKISVPLASVIFGLVGAPLGIRPHRGEQGDGVRCCHRHHIQLLGGVSVDVCCGPERRASADCRQLYGLFSWDDRRRDPYRSRKAIGGPTIVNSL
jgi:lipopolysaccharide export system permease protein